MDLLGRKTEHAASKQRISARISEDRRCFSAPLRLAVQDFCGADQIGGCQFEEEQQNSDGEQEAGICASRLIARPDFRSYYSVIPAKSGNPGASDLTIVPCSSQGQADLDPAFAGATRAQSNLIGWRCSRT